MLSLPFWPFVPGVAETLLRLPSTGPFTGDGEKSWSPSNVLTWFLLFVTGLCLLWLQRLGKSRDREPA